MAFAQYAAQASPDPAVYFCEGALIAVFEVFKPSSKHRVEMCDDGLHAVAVGALGQRAHAVAQLADGLVVRPARYLALAGPLEVVAEGVESLIRLAGACLDSRLP